MRPKNHQWFEQRRYCHFDRPLNAERAERLVASPEEVARHAFSPLIWLNKSQRVWKRHKETETREDLPPVPQPVSGPRPAKRGQAEILRAREAAGEKTNRGYWKTKKRPIAYASHADSAIYSYYHFVWRGEYEAALRRLEIGDCPLAYRFIPRTLKRRGKSSFHFAAESFAAIDRLGTCRAHCLDIESFFDNIPHRLLLEQFRRVVDATRISDDQFHVLKSAMRSARVPLKALRRHLKISKRSYEKMRKMRLPFELGAQGVHGLARAGILESGRQTGIPQGLPLSGLLANIAMLEIDRQIAKLAAATECTYRRYSDDILIFGPAKAADELAAEARRLIEGEGFKVPPKKATTHTFTVEAGGSLVVDVPLVYLGLEFDGTHVRIRPSTIARLEKRAKRCVDCMARAALRLDRSWCEGGTFRLNRRRIYNLFSPLPFKGSQEERKKWRGDFTDYARSAQTVVDDAFGRPGVSRITKQLHPRMRKLSAYIKTAESEVVNRLKTRNSASATKTKCTGPSVSEA